jgi:hypothetical protein
VVCDGQRPGVSRRADGVFARVDQRKCDKKIAVRIEVLYRFS